MSRQSYWGLSGDEMHSALSSRCLLEVIEHVLRQLEQYGRLGDMLSRVHVVVAAIQRDSASRHSRGSHAGYGVCGIVMQEIGDAASMKASQFGGQRSHREQLSFM